MEVHLMKRKLLGFILSVSMLISALSPMAYAEALTEDGQDIVFDGSEELSEEKLAVAQCLDGLVAGKDYVSDEITYFADTKQDAERVAEAYGAKLASYSYGVATASVTLSAGEDLQDVFLDAVDDDKLPKVYPNYIVRLDKQEFISDISSDKEQPNGDGGPAPLLAGDLSYSDDPYSSTQYYHYYVDDYKLWNKGVTGKGVVVAVLDTGVNIDHLDIKDNITEFRFNSSYELDEKGKIIKEGHDDHDVTDNHGHGSNVAGLIAAKRNNGIGGCGVAPEAKIMPIKVMNSRGSGFDSWVAAGIVASAENGADIINMSLGGNYAESIYPEAINKARELGAIVIASAGNDTTDKYKYPACFDGVISVAALAPGADEEGRAEELAPDDIITQESLDYIAGYDLTLPLRAAYFTNYQDTVAAAVPGTAMLSLGIKGNDSYIYMSGTSQAAPVVAGIIALLKSYDRSLGENEVKELLKKSNDKTVYYSTLTDGYPDPSNVRVRCGATNALRAYNVLSHAYDDIEIKAPVIVTPSMNSIGRYISGVGSYLTIENPNPDGVKVYYTEDGSDPRTNGNVYSTPISIDYSGKKTIKAVAEFGGRFSKVAKFTGKFEQPRVDGLKVITDTGFWMDSADDYFVAEAFNDIAWDEPVAYLPIGNKKASVKLMCEDSNGDSVMPFVELKSTDESVITVNKKGVVKPAKGAKYGDEASIIIKTLDGSNIERVVKFKVFDSIKNLSFKVGKDGVFDEYEKSLTYVSDSKGGFSFWYFREYNDCDECMMGGSVYSGAWENCYLNDKNIAWTSLLMSFSEDKVYYASDTSQYFDCDMSDWSTNERRAVVTLKARDGSRATFKLKYKRTGK